MTPSKLKKIRSNKGLNKEMLKTIQCSFLKKVDQRVEEGKLVPDFTMSHPCPLNERVILDVPVTIEQV